MYCYNSDCDRCNYFREKNGYKLPDKFVKQRKENRKEFLAHIINED